LFIRIRGPLLTPPESTARRRGVEAVQYPVELTIAGGGGGCKSRPYIVEQCRREALRLDLPAKNGTE
jgi:hypothetical protein